MANHRGTVERPTNDQGDLAGSASPKRSLVLADAGAILASLLVLLVVHPVGSVLTSPYWLDEAWVALSSRAPLAALPTTTASTPLGWTFLVWLLPAHGQIHRLIAYAFLTASVIAGYGFARTLGWPGRVPALLAGLTAAAAVTLLPAQQLRHDLKQYTADAAVALVLLALSARLEPSPESRSSLESGPPEARSSPVSRSAGEAAPAGEAASKRGSPFRAAGLAGAVTVGMLFSHPAALVGVAVLGGPFVVAVLGRRWRRLPGLLVEAAPAVVAMGAVYLLADGAARNRAMVDYWAGYFPRPGELPRYLIERADQLRPAIGLAWPLYLLLFAAGVVTLVRLGRPATAAAVVTLPVVAVVAGVGRVYPLLDLRTSHFLLVTGAVTVAVGLVGTVTAATRLSARAPRPVVAGLRVVFVAAAVAGFAAANRGRLDRAVPPGDARENVRAQVRYVAAHRRPGDAILVNLSGQYGFGYYWSADRPEFVKGGVQATGWYVRYPPGRRIVIAAGRDPASVAAALARARGLVTGGGRLWLVRSHVNADESRAWREALAGEAVRSVAVGVEPVAVITPPAPTRP